MTNPLGINLSGRRSWTEARTGGQVALIIVSKFDKQKLKILWLSINIGK